MLCRIVAFATAAVFCVSMCLAAEKEAACSAQHRIPVIFDTDIGDDIDDIWALAMLLRCPQFDVQLVTTTNGKTEYRGKIIAKTLAAAGRTDIPVGLGAGDRAGVGGEQDWVKDYKLSDYPGKIFEDGVGAVIDMIMQSSEPITIICVGPPTTVAAALDRQPEIAKKALFVGMHGAVRKGYNNSDDVCGEYNVTVDVKAAQKVLSAPWRHITITPLDTCGLVRLSGERFQRPKASSDPLVQAVLDNYRIWANKKSIDELRESTVLFDTVAVYLTLPGEKPLVQFETLPISVTDEGITKIDTKGATMSVATSWKNLDGFRDLLVKTLLGL